MERTILHCDLNSFYASVEVYKNPELRGKAVAVCGNKEDRHGIVLAKSDSAKRMGVQTGEAIWQAQQKCPELIIVAPSFDDYMQFSQKARKIYEDYTDLIQPFGLDECWLDVTASRALFGTGEQIAEKIRRRMKEEVGLTISVGVSFNKVFAKLGSDLKKPDAVTVISKEHFKEQLWSLPASDMIGVGRATARILSKYGIDTLGELAQSSPEFLKELLGKNGTILWSYANGMDNSPVDHMDYSPPIKSIGHGITCSTDLMEENEVWQVVSGLAQDVSHRLRKHCLMAGGVQLTIKDNTLQSCQHQCILTQTTQSFLEIGKAAQRLFTENYEWKFNVRALTVRAINLSPANAPQQLGLLEDFTRSERRNKAEIAMETVRQKFGKGAIDMASRIKIVTLRPESVPCALPNGVPR